MNVHLNTEVAQTCDANNSVGCAAGEGAGGVKRFSSSLGNVNMDSIC